MRRNAIAYVLNASNTCPKPDFIPDSRFLRVPVDDGFRDKILPWLDASLDFIGQRAVAPPGRFPPLWMCAFLMCASRAFQRRPRRRRRACWSTAWRGSRARRPSPSRTS